MAHFVGSLFFGIAFIFIVVGRSELFTENFFVPITALRRGKLKALKLAELWTISPVMNILGGTALILIATTKGVLPEGTAAGAQRARPPHRRAHLWSAFCSAIIGGALITAMTWMVEGVGTVGGRIVVAWIAGTLLALASLNHVIVVTLELIFGLRLGTEVTFGEVGLNFAIAAAGNMIGGLIFVTLTRTSQAIGSGETDDPSRSSASDAAAPARGRCARRCDSARAPRCRARSCRPGRRGSARRRAGSAGRRALRGAVSCSCTRAIIAARACCRIVRAPGEVGCLESIDMRLPSSVAASPASPAAG